MNKETLRKIQLIQLEILKEIAQVCDNHKINYCLIGGTLLGAIRHKGFIPWDDDLDIGMLRDDYEKFIQIAPTTLGEKFKFIDWKSDSDYPHPMGKVIKKGTIYKESKRNDLGEQGIWVDVFPYDNIQNTDSALKKKGFKLKVLRGLIRAKCNYQTWHSESGIVISKFIKNIPFRIFAIFMKKDKLIKKYESICKMDGDLDCDYIYENGTENYADWCFPKECFTYLIKVEFEDTFFPIPQKYHEYLEKAYGDYMQLPPENQRENKHLIEEVDFGE